LFETITNLTDLNQARAKAVQAAPRTEWASINLAFTKKANELRNAVKTTSRVQMKSIAPIVVVKAQQGGSQVDAEYDPIGNVLSIFQLHDSSVKVIPTGSERSVKIQMRQGYIAAGVSL
jgi:hypothetical protein